MANPDGHIAGMVATIYKQGESTYVTYNTETSTGSTSRMKDWEFEWEENYPRKIRIVLDNSDQTSTVNVLNAAYAGWSSTKTGAMDIGDEVSLTLISNDTSTSTALVQYAKVVDIETAPDNSVTLIAIDRTARLDGIKKDRVVWKSYQDKIIKEHLNANGTYYCEGVTDTGIVQPLAFVGFAHTDYRVDFGNGSPAATEFGMYTSTDLVAQSFIAQGDGFLGIEGEYKTQDYYSTTDVVTSTGTADGTLNMSLQTDNNNTPSGTKLSENTIINLYANTSTTTATTFDWDPGNVTHEPIQITKGQRYWIVFKGNLSTGSAAKYLKIVGEDAGDYPVKCYKYYTASAWNTQEDDVLDLNVDVTNFESYDNTQYYYDGATTLYVLGMDTSITTVDTYYDIYRTKLSYYHGTNAMYLIQQALCSLDTGMNYDFPNTFAKTYGTFATRGKPLGDCFRELADQFQDFTETTGVMRQTVIAQYTSTYHYLKGSKRYDTTNDTESYVICHGLDTSNDDERIIVGTPDIKKKNAGRYGRVIVAGKADDGTPVFAARSDRAKTGSYWEKTDGICETLKVYDENLRTTADCNTEAWRIMDLVNRNVWEGSINLSGNHLLFDFDHTSDFYGSGKILKLTWSPLGIYTTKMKVTKIILRPNNTTVFVNNLDVLTLNKIKNSMKTTEKSEVFLSPLGEPETVYFDIYTTDAPATTGYYMTVVNEDGDELPHLQRVLCTVYNTSTLYSSDTYNMQTFHAEFTPDNGYSVDTSRIRYIELHSAKTGGSYSYQKDLNATVDGVLINEVFDKWKGQRLVVDWNCKAS